MLKNLSPYAIALTLFVSGCASTTVRHYAVAPTGAIDNKLERGDNGVRFYENSPYILVYIAGEKYQAQELYLPDTTTVFTAKPENLFAVNNSKLTLTDGVLTEASIEIDTVALPKAVIAAVKKLALGDAPLAMKSQADGTAPKAMLYKVGQDDAGRPALLSAQAIY